MKTQDVLKLLDAGYTKEEISTMDLNPADNPEPDHEEQPEEHTIVPETVHETVEHDATAERIEQMQSQIDNLIKQMQRNNLKSASVNMLPEDDLEKKTDDAMAELIRPKYKEKEM